jgi:hypothetical protein
MNVYQKIAFIERWAKVDKNIANSKALEWYHLPITIGEKWLLEEVMQRLGFVIIGKTSLKLI